MVKRSVPSAEQHKFLQRLKFLRGFRNQMGFPHGTSGKEPTSQCRRRKRCGFDPWVGEIPWRRESMATPSSIPAWRILWTEEPGGLQSIGSHRVGQD